jgi:histidine ammonia-lyase
MITVDGGALSIDALVRAARDREAVRLDPGVRARMAPARDVVDHLDREGAVVYGVTTGFGALADRAVDPPDRSLLQRSVVLSHAAGAGPRLDDEVVRGMILLRARTLSAGLSGVRPDLVEALLALLDAGITPWVPEHGSLGASGDLAPLAHIATVLLGQGSIVGGDGGRIEAAEALRAHGLTPVDVEPKEGLALINGTDAMATLIALAVHDIEELLRAADIACALSVEALLCTTVAYGEEVIALRPAKGQAPGQPDRRLTSRVAPRRPGCLLAALRTPGARRRP